MTIKPAPTVIWRIVDDEVLFLDTQTGNYMALNTTGAVVWELLVSGLTEAEIAQQIAARYGVPLESALGDVAELVAELKAEALVL